MPVAPILADVLPPPIWAGGDPYIELFGAVLAAVIVGCAVAWVIDRRRR